ncbi:hypothetical protein YPPY13_1036 [Yersinia pestis PY-13]|uniref:Uncharacterized protein n=1 Tax=Yersinia pestis PY-08 TaxID=992134 RepID=A0AB72ZNC8_YERPE|nr:hypothetical protein YPC_0968 [Yersinia pestis biovar Medievalis str. Harbin 35]EDR50547.1 hypothetical protein YpB42003004_3119 [Yersinia pestis biovar Antiqua str. B42003004]EEO75530.1 hypothetical protein YP516_3455 [Yersinia pestis Nepal516]EEO83054.1 hypothetical protein YPF_1034 [Yersinia pestis biovar Orientalis str. India 195]EEO87164.1 hypothetical protein YPH_3099 [Yersinia pestis biovar Orientalis str. PEXU2]EEO91223.1 hypothetical protein YPS_1447 [Yersinia pestis Pestoides A]E
MINSQFFNVFITAHLFSGNSTGSAAAGLIASDGWLNQISLVTTLVWLITSVG